MLYFLPSYRFTHALEYSPSRNSNGCQVFCLDFSLWFGLCYSSFIIQVWASKWNERAYFSTRKVKLDHDYLCMAVLVQEIINADYAFVIHTTNPSSGDDSEIYAEVIF